MKTSQIFIEQCMSTINPSKQWIVSGRNEQTTIVNAFSLDQFFPYRLIPQHHRKQCQQFEQRQKYTFPHTPKIIIIPNPTRPHQQILLLAQRGQFQFQKFVQHYQNDRKGQIELALQIFTTAEMLQKKYGYFKLTDSMIRASKGPSLLIWINQNQASNQPQYPIGPIYPINLHTKKTGQRTYSPLQTMIKSIFNILQSNFSSNAFISEICREEYQLNFFNVRMKLSQSAKSQTNSICIITNPALKKCKRYTSQKRKNIPQFLLNRTISKENQKLKQRKFDQSVNKKSAITYSLHQSTKNQSFNSTLMKKPLANKYASEKRKPSPKDTEILSFLQKNTYRENNTVTQENQTLLSEQTIRFQCQKLRSSQPYHKVVQNHLQYSKKEQKTLVRQSGKSVSTNTANYFSVHSSGKRIFYNSQQEPKYLFKKVQKVTEPKTKQITHQSQAARKLALKQLQHRISNIIQQKSEQNVLPSKKNSLILASSPRSPSIIGALINKSQITQKSIPSPGSQFYKEVDFILQSGGLSKNFQSDVEHSIEGQLHKILFD